MLFDADLVRHVCQTTGLDAEKARRVVDDVLTLQARPVTDLVRQRHRSLKSDGLKNEVAFGVIEAELPLCVVSAPRLTTRQIRRVVYG